MTVFRPDARWLSAPQTSMASVIPVGLERRALLVPMIALVEQRHALVAS
jgi:hypothetical protein